MQKRKRISKKYSKKKFVKGAVKTHRFNMGNNSSPMRGGIRM